MGRYERYSRFPRYIPVAERKEKIEKKINALKKKGEVLQPIIIKGRTIAMTFWGKAWCKNLEIYSDYENRLPRGRSYVRNGAIIDLAIFSHGEVKAQVQGSRLYQVSVIIKPCDDNKWRNLAAECAHKIDSLIELLQGKFSKSVMEIITNKDTGLFPSSREISFDCSCPDYASMCKHVAAVLYGVGSRLDEKPEELFILRQVDHLELIDSAAVVSALNKGSASSLQNADLAALFDIDFEGGNGVVVASPKKVGRLAGKKPVKKVTKKAVKKVAKKTVSDKSKRKASVVVGETPKRRGRPRKSV